MFTATSIRLLQYFSLDQNNNDKTNHTNLKDHG